MLESRKENFLNSWMGSAIKQYVIFHNAQSLTTFCKENISKYILCFFIVTNTSTISKKQQKFLRRVKSKCQDVYGIPIESSVVKHELLLVLRKKIRIINYKLS